MRQVMGFLHHFFIPRGENNYRARSLHPDFLSYYLIFALILTFVVKQFNATPGDILGFATDITVEKLYELTNQERTKYNLPSLIYNDKLAQAAYQKAEDMFAKNYWAHYAPDGVSPWDFILNNGYRYEYAGENLAKNFLFSDGVVDAWMKSISHRENILRKEYSNIGFAIVNGVLNGEETTLVVQFFGTPIETNYLAQNKTPSTRPLKQIKPIVANNKLQASILAKNTAQPKVNLSYFSFNINFFFIFFLILALALDFYFAVRLNLIRIHGKHVAHLMFLGFILLGLLYVSKGSIL